MCWWQRLALAAAIAAGFEVGVVRAQSTMDFESVPDGTVFGGMADPPDTPGAAVLEENHIGMSVDTFIIGGFPEFFAASVGTGQVDELPTRSLLLDNIGVAFDFAGVGFDVGSVTFDFADRGGGSNFMVNGGEMFILDFLGDVPSDVAPGVTAEIVGGSIHLFTDEATTISDVAVGGQELYIDNVSAVVPEPATLLLITIGVATCHSAGRGHRARPRRRAS